jgi:hypothetical protein
MIFIFGSKITGAPMKKILSVAAIALLLLSAGSCKKITEDQLINGLWKLDAVYADTSSVNLMNTVLPNYNGGFNYSAYKLDFQKDNVIIAYYMSHDSFLYVTPGHWDVPQSNQVIIKLDKFIDGTFNITRPTSKQWVLKSTANHIEYYDGINPNLDTTATELIIEKI